jgi:hypothetical protein
MMQSAKDAYSLGALAKAASPNHNQSIECRRMPVKWRIQSAHTTQCWAAAAAHIARHQTSTITRQVATISRCICTHMSDMSIPSQLWLLLLLLLLLLPRLSQHHRDSQPAVLWQLRPMLMMSLPSSVCQLQMRAMLYAACMQYV